MLFKIIDRSRIKIDKQSWLVRACVVTLTGLWGVYLHIAVSSLLSVFTRQYFKISGEAVNRASCEILSLIRFLNAIGHNDVEILWNICAHHNERRINLAMVSSFKELCWEVFIALLIVLISRRVTTISSDISKTYLGVVYKNIVVF